MTNQETAEKVTACMNCIYHHNTSTGHIPSMWYYQICMAPGVEKPEIFNPVIGRHQPSSRPYCREINNGDCSYYQE